MDTEKIDRILFDIMEYSGTLIICGENIILH